MPAQVAVTIIDEVPGRGRQVAFKLELWSEKVTARELIERRVRHEVDVHNLKPADTFLGLVQPSDSERAVNGWRLKKPRSINAEEQIASAWEAFTSGRILLLVDDRQVDTLDEEFTLRRDAEVCFYKLVPLVGG
jgi:hypothetical protein